MPKKYSDTNIYKFLRPTNDGLFFTDFIIGGEINIKKNLKIKKNIIFNSIEKKENKGIKLEYYYSLINNSFNYNIEGLVPISHSITSALRHSLILLNTGKVLAFGDNTDGVLGMGYFSDDSGDPSGIKSYNMKDYLGNYDNQSYDGTNAISVKSHVNNSAVLLKSGKLITFGRNSESANKNGGYLGHGNTNFYHSNDPSGVKENTGYDGKNIVDFSLGCGHTLILLNTGKVISYGINTRTSDNNIIYGQLGHGKDESYGTGDASSVKDKNLKDYNGNIDNSSYDGTNAIGVYTGCYHSAILLKTGKLLTFGSNTNPTKTTGFGQLGHGTTNTYYSTEPVSVKKTADYDETNAIYFSSYGHHSGVLLNSGKVLTFGDNTNGQLGHGNNKIGVHTGIPTPVNDSSGYNGTNAVKVSCGANHSAILLNTGKVLTFGNNRQGQLGQGNTTDFNSGDPSGVIHKNEYNGINAIDVYCGNEITFILLDIGKVISFGHSWSGELGTGEIRVKTGVPSNVVDASGYNFYNCLTVSKNLIETEFDFKNNFFPNILNNSKTSQLNHNLNKNEEKIFFDNKNLTVTSSLPSYNTYLKSNGII